MSFPAKYRGLLELTLKDVEVPDYAWLTYAVCGVTSDACGWGGWIIDGIFKQTAEHHATGTGDKALPNGDDLQTCPRCGRTLFRTSASIRMTLSADQAPVHGVPGVDYDVADMQYDDG
ncbi:MAG TPA: hypothetical protein VLB76_03735 [Thermoanaerobaculia bacterium]|nr:hypothetical protein [Thermoanaerobaculia bacterium]